MNQKVILFDNKTITTISSFKNLRQPTHDYTIHILYFWFSSTTPNVMELPSRVCHS